MMQCVGLKSGLWYHCPYTEQTRGHKCTVSLVPRLYSVRKKLLHVMTFEPIQGSKVNSFSCAEESLEKRLTHRDNTACHTITALYRLIFSPGLWSHVLISVRHFQKIPMPAPFSRSLLPPPSTTSAEEG